MNKDKVVAIACLINLKMFFVDSKVGVEYINYVLELLGGVKQQEEAAHFCDTSEELVEFKKETAKVLAKRLKETGTDNCALYDYLAGISKQ